MKIIIIILVIILGTVYSVFASLAISRTKKRIFEDLKFIADRNKENIALNTLKEGKKFVHNYSNVQYRDFTYCRFNGLVVEDLINENEQTKINYYDHLRYLE